MQRVGEILSAPDPSENYDRMLTHITLGVSKEASSTVYDADTSERWDRLEASVRESERRGYVVAYSNDPNLFDPEAEY